MELGEKVSIHTNYNLFWDRYDQWDGEWEDAFIAIDLPGDVSLRGGQFLMPFGLRNQIHLHDREFVEPPISMIRLLGEDGLFVQGADLAFHLPAPEKRPSSASATAKPAPTTTASPNAKPAATSTSKLSKEKSTMITTMMITRKSTLTASPEMAASTMRMTPTSTTAFFFARLATDVPAIKGLDLVGVSFAAGENGFGRTTWIAECRPERQLQGRRSPRLVAHRSLLPIRQGLRHQRQPRTLRRNRIYASCGLEFAEDWTTAARLEWASGNRDVGAERRWRASRQHWPRLPARRARRPPHQLQYSYDDLGGYGHDHAIWLQFVLNIGASEHGHNH